VDLVVQSVAGVIYPVDVQSLVIQGIVAIHIGIGVMDNSIDEWSLVQSVEGSWDTSSVISPPLQFRPKSAPLQREPLPQGPRLVSPFQVSDLRPLATSSIGCSGQSSAQLHTGIPRISDLCHGSEFLPPQQLPVDSIRIVPGSNPLQIPAQNLPVIQSWTTLQQNLDMPQPQRCLGFSDSGIGRVCTKQTYFHSFASSQTSTRGYQQISFFQCITFALSDVV
jgi:hypothetical protein